MPTLTATKPFRHHTRRSTPLRPLTTRRRPHQQLDEGSATTAELWTSDGVLSNLAAEWSACNESGAATRAVVHTWGLAQPALHGHTNPGQILDAIDAGTPQDKDAKLGALLVLAHTGDALASRTLLQAMLPKLHHIARYADTGSDRQEDRGQITVAAFLDVAARYRTDRHTTGIPGRLALDTLHTVTRARRGPAAITEVPVEDIESHVTATAAHTQPHSNAAAELDQVLAWALSATVITSDEHDLLGAVFSPLPGHAGGHAAVAAARGLSPAAVRQRCSRATRRIRVAVLEAAGTTG